MASDSHSQSAVPILISGHSLGGAISCFLGQRLQRDLPNSDTKYDLQGIVLLDVTEGIALGSLRNSEKFINDLPSSFKSLETAHKWGLKHLVKNEESALVSLTSQLKEEGDRWVWRTDLKGSTQHWSDWFKGMDTAFLGMERITRILVLSSVDSLDTTLTVAHMQGRIQVNILSKVGHIVQEDQPKAVAAIFLDWKAKWQKIKTLGYCWTKSLSKREAKELG